MKKTIKCAELSSRTRGGYKKDESLHSIRFRRDVKHEVLGKILTGVNHTKSSHYVPQLAGATSCKCLQKKDYEKTSRKATRNRLLGNTLESPHSYN